MATLATTATTAQSADRPRFFANSALVLLALVVASFSFTYLAPLATGSRHFAPIYHIHGLAYFAWMALYAWQTHLVATRRSARHRELGLAGVALSAIMVPLGVALSIAAIHRRMGLGDPHPFDNALYNVFDLLTFGGFMTASIAAVTRHVDWHRRFTYAAALCLVGPSLSRWLAFMPSFPPLSDMLPNLGASLFLVALALHDRRTTGRVHPATWVAIAVLPSISILVPLLTANETWRSIAPSIDRLMG